MSRPVRVQAAFDVAAKGLDPGKTGREMMDYILAIEAENALLKDRLSKCVDECSALLRQRNTALAEIERLRAALTAIRQKCAEEHVEAPHWSVLREDVDEIAEAALGDTR